MMPTRMISPKSAEAKSEWVDAMAMYEPRPPAEVGVPLNGTYSSIGIRYQPDPQANMLVHMSSG